MVLLRCLVASQFRNHQFPFFKLARKILPHLLGIEIEKGTAGGEVLKKDFTDGIGKSSRERRDRNKPT